MEQCWLQSKEVDQTALKSDEWTSLSSVGPDSYSQSVCSQITQQLTQLLGNKVKICRICGAKKKRVELTPLGD